MPKLNLMQDKMSPFFLPAQCCAASTGCVNDDVVNAKHTFNVESQSNEVTVEDEIFGYFRREMKSTWPCKF